MRGAGYFFVYGSRFGGLSSFTIGNVGRMGRFQQDLLAKCMSQRVPCNRGLPLPVRGPRKIVSEIHAHCSLRCERRDENYGTVLTAFGGRGRDSQAFPCVYRV